MYVWGGGRFTLTDIWVSGSVNVKPVCVDLLECCLSVILLIYYFCCWIYQLQLYVAPGPCFDRPVMFACRALM